MDIDRSQGRRRSNTMLLIFAVLAILSAAFLLFRYAKRHDHEITNQNFVPIEPPANARPLFAPTDAELIAETKARTSTSIARREYRAKAAARAKVDQALADWREAKDAASAAVLLRVTAADGLEGDLARAASEIIEVFRESGVGGLTSSDLATLLDSHIRLLSVSERGSGAIFWLKQEVAKLRPVIDVEQR